MLKCVCIYAVVAGVHHVVVHARKAECRVRACDDFESLVAAGRRDYCVGGRYGWDDVFDDALGHGVGDAWDVKFVGAGECFVVEPGDVVWIVRV